MTPDELATGLRDFGAAMLAFIPPPQAVAARRMVMAEAGHSDAGHLRQVDPELAARFFFALLTAETEHLLFGRDFEGSNRRQCE